MPLANFSIVLLWEITVRTVWNVVMGIKIFRVAAKISHVINQKSFDSLKSKALNVSGSYVDWTLLVCFRFLARTMRTQDSRPHLSDLDNVQKPRSWSKLHDKLMHNTTLQNITLISPPYMHTNAMCICDTHTVLSHRQTLIGPKEIVGFSDFLKGRTDLYLSQSEYFCSKQQIGRKVA